MDKITIVNDMKAWNIEVVRLEHTQAHTILDNQLYLSHGTPAQDESLLQLDGITHVLNTAIDVPTQKFKNIQVSHLKLYDSPDQTLPFPEAARFIQTALSKGGKCLVHCNAGQSRSASMIIYYLMTLGHTLKDSYTYVKTRKPNIGPNFGFASQLEQAEIVLHDGKSTLDMTEYKADNLLEILEGSGKSKNEVMEALKETSGDAHAALENLLGLT